MNVLSLTDLNTEIDGEPRMLDLRLAEALEFARPRVIRDLITRHEQALTSFGRVCRTVRQTSSKGGRPAQETYLNKKQCLYLCTKSETPRATDVTIQMVEVFDAWTSAQSAAGTVHVKAHGRRTSTTIDEAIKLKTNIDRLENLVSKMEFSNLAPPEVIYGPWVAHPHGQQRRNYRLSDFNGLGEAIDLYMDGIVAMADQIRGVKPAANANVPPIGRPPVYRDQIIALTREGYAAKDIIRKTGASPYTVRFWRRRLKGLPGR